MKKLLMIGGTAGLIAGGALLIAGLARVGERPAKLTWRDPEIKSALMTLGYKIYANPKVEDGRHYLSKFVFKNSGEHPVTDFSISYKIDDYIPWTEPDEIHAIPAAFTLVKLYYPKLPATVTKLRNATNVTFRARVLWKEEGRPHEEMFTRDVVLRGVNELESCDLPQGEVRSWHDLKNAVHFAVAMVTPNDPVVNLYASEITRLSGGTTAGTGQGREEVIRLCRHIYDYMLLTGLRYVAESGTTESFDDISSWVQTVRLPRDVIQTNQGVCIDLGILWSSILEHVGINAAMVFRPGHVFVIAYSPQDNMPLSNGIAIECTAITPRAVGREAVVPFEEAVKMATEDLQKCLKDGRILIFPVKEYQAMGFIPPELADVDTDRLTETLRKRLPEAAPPEREQAFRGPNPGPTPPARMTTWQHPQGLVAISFPADFVSMLQPGVSPDFLLLSAGNPATGVSCDVMHVTGTQDPVQAVNYVASVFAQMGATIRVTGSTALNNGAALLEGMTTSAGGGVRWNCIAKPVPGGVLLVSAGASSATWSAHHADIQAILASVRFQ